MQDVLLVSIIVIMQPAKKQRVLGCDFAISSKWAEIIASFAEDPQADCIASGPNLSITPSTAVGSTFQGALPMRAVLFNLSKPAGTALPESGSVNAALLA